MPTDTDALVLGVVNPKGGTGKTTIAVHLARAVQLDGLSSVVLDTDPQGSAVDWRRRAPDEYDAPPVVSVTDPKVLRSDVTRLTSAYDVAILDGVAQLQGMTGAILTVSDAVLVPVQPSALDLWGTKEFLDLVTDRVQGGSLRAAFVASRRDTRTTLSDEITDALDNLELPVLTGTAQRVAYVRSMAAGKTVLDGYDAKADAEVRQLLDDVASLFTDTE